MLTARVLFLVQSGFDPARSTLDLRWKQLFERIQDWKGSRCTWMRGGGEDRNPGRQWLSDHGGPGCFLFTPIPGLRPPASNPDDVHWMSGPPIGEPEKTESTWVERIRSWFARRPEPDLWILERNDQRRGSDREDIFPPGVDTRSFSPDPRVRRVDRLVLVLREEHRDRLADRALHVVPMESDRRSSPGPEPLCKDVVHRKRLFQQAGGFWIDSADPWSSRLALEAGASGCPMVVRNDRLPGVELYPGTNCWKAEDMTVDQLVEMSHTNDSELKRRVRQARTQIRRHHEWDHIADRLIQRIRARL